MIRHLIILFFFISLPHTYAEKEKNIEKEVVEMEESNSPWTIKALLFPFYIPEFTLRGVDFLMGSFVNWVQKFHVIERTLDFLSNEDRTRWVYPIITLGGSDTKLGVGYFHKNLWKSSYRVSFSFQSSFKANMAVKGSFSDPLLLRFQNRNLGYSFGATYSKKKDENFFGLGNQTSQSTEGNFYRESVGVSTNAFLETSMKIKASLGLGFEHHKTTDPSEGASIALLPNSNNFFGFRRSLNFMVMSSSFTHQDTYPGGSPMEGGGRLVSLKYYRAIEGLRYSGLLSHISLRHYLQLSSRKQALAFHIAWAHLYKFKQHEFPFYLLPQLENTTPLRSLSGNRFTDTGYFITNAEYRYPVWRFHFINLQTFIFFDLGRTYDQIEKLDFNNLHWATGGGFYFNTPNKFISHIVFATGNDAAFKFTFRFGRSI